MHKREKKSDVWFLSIIRNPDVYCRYTILTLVPQVKTYSVVLRHGRFGVAFEHYVDVREAQWPLQERAKKGNRVFGVSGNEQRHANEMPRVGEKNEACKVCNGDDGRRRGAGLPHWNFNNDPPWGRDESTEASKEAVEEAGFAPARFWATIGAGR